MRKPHKLNRKKDRKRFRKTAMKTNGKNFQISPMRGGIRL